MFFKTVSRRYPDHSIMVTMRNIFAVFLLFFPLVSLLYFLDSHSPGCIFSLALLSVPNPVHRAHVPVSRLPRGDATPGIGTLCSLFKWSPESKSQIPYMPIQVVFLSIKSCCKAFFFQRSLRHRPWIEAHSQKNLERL